MDVRTWFNPKDPETIQKENPFPQLKLKIISRLGEDKGFSGQVFKVQDLEGKFYKLRMCKDEQEAAKIAGYAKRIAEHMPRFHGQDGRYLLFDLFEGVVMSKGITTEDCFEMGRIYAEVHKLSAEGSPDTQRDKFLKHVKIMHEKNAITPQEYAAIVELFQTLEKRIEHNLVVEIFDLHPDNFMVGDKTAFIDEGGVHITFKGAGFIKAFEKLDKEQQEAFRQGYKSVDSMEYFSGDYEKFVTLYSLVEWIYDRIRKDVNAGKYLVPLRSLINTGQNPFRE